MAHLKASDGFFTSISLSRYFFLILRSFSGMETWLPFCCQWSIIAHGSFFIPPTFPLDMMYICSVVNRPHALKLEIIIIKYKHEIVFIWCTYLYYFSNLAPLWILLHLVSMVFKCIQTVSVLEWLLKYSNEKKSFSTKNIKILSVQGFIFISHHANSPTAD